MAETTADEIRQARASGELLGPLVDKYGVEAVVAALGVLPIAYALGVTDDVPDDYDKEPSNG